MVSADASPIDLSHPMAINLIPDPCSADPKRSNIMLQHQETTMSKKELDRSITESLTESTFSKDNYVDGADLVFVKRMAKQKHITSSNVDRWKRTFQSIVIPSAKTDKNDSKTYLGGRNLTRTLSERSLRSQPASIFDDAGSDEEENLFVEISRKDLAKSRGVFYPDSFWKQVWEILGLIFIIIQAIVVPFKLAFVIDASFGWNIFELIMDCYFISDIFIYFNTGFYKEGILVMTRTEIACHYLKSWFLLDLFSSFPYSWVFEGCVIDENCLNSGNDDSSYTSKSSSSSSSSSSSFIYFKAPQLLRLLKIVRFLRVLRLLRVLKMRKLIMKLEENMISGLLTTVLEFLQMFSYIMLLAHWMACIFYYIGREGSSSDSSSWILTYSLIDKDISEQYITALYWAITTMLTVGYGDIRPITYSEQICGILCMIVSCFIFAHILGSIRGIIARTSEIADKMYSQMSNVNKFLIHRRIPKEMRMKVRSYLTYILEEKKKLQMEEEEMVELLSTPIRDELTIYFHGSLLRRCQIFDDFSVDFLSYLMFFMRVEHFSINDIIYEKGETGNKMYFIVKGTVLLFFKPPITVIAKLNDDDYFGDNELFGLKVREYYARSVTFVQTLSLSRDGLYLAADHFPDAKERLTEIIQDHQGELTMNPKKPTNELQALEDNTGSFQQNEASSPDYQNGKEEVFKQVEEIIGSVSSRRRSEDNYRLRDNEGEEEGTNRERESREQSDTMKILVRKKEND